ncbi:hypothetical protein ACFVKB_39180 [Rhodococcus sp. NPDC127530]
MTAPNLTAAESDVVWAAYTAAEGLQERTEPADRTAGGPVAG